MTFTISVTLPFDHLHMPAEFVTRPAIREITQAAEKAGFHAGCVTDHPAPSNKWLEHGGHHAQDPFVILAMAGSFTERLKLRTGILVLPYRNPFVTARAVSTLDVFTDGRVELGVGAGYMKKEYAALGVHFENRNDLMDEYIAAMKLAWTGVEFDFSGTGYGASGIRIAPATTQQPNPPLLIGGNSKRAIRRAVELGDAWYPFFVPPMVTNTARTTNISDEADLRASLDYFHDCCTRSNRTAAPQLVCSGLFSAQGNWSSQDVLDRVGFLRSLGFVSGDAGIIADTRSEWVEQALRFGEEVIARLD